MSVSYYRPISAHVSGRNAREIYCSSVGARMLAPISPTLFLARRYIFISRQMLAKHVVLYRSSIRKGFTIVFNSCSPASICVKRQVLEIRDYVTARFRGQRCNPPWWKILLKFVLS